MGAFRGLSLAAMSQLVACLVVHPSPMISTRLMAPAVSGSAVKMQYGQQQGYGGGYGQQQGYGAQQQGYGSQVLWRIYGANGVCGHTMFTGVVSAVNKNRFGSIGEKYSQLPYTLVANDERILSKWNMINNQVPTVSRSQCKVNLYPDGTTVLTSQGSCAPTLVRNQGGAWIPIYAGQSHYLTSGDQISLDASNPEGAVFTCQNEAGGADPHQGYGMQQQGYGMQQGYGQQQGYPQQGGYGY